MASDVNRKAKWVAAILFLVISLVKFDSRMQAFKRVMDLTCTGKEEELKWLSKLILLNGFRILAIKFLAILTIKNLSN